MKRRGSVLLITAAFAVTDDDRNKCRHPVKKKSWHTAHRESANGRSLGLRQGGYLITTFSNVVDSLEYHFAKHGGGLTLEQYTLDAERFFETHRVRPCGGNGTRTGKSRSG